MHAISTSGGSRRSETASPAVGSGCGSDERHHRDVFLLQCVAQKLYRTATLGAPGGHRHLHCMLRHWAFDSALRHHRGDVPHQREAIRLLHRTHLHWFLYVRGPETIPGIFKN